MSKEKNTKNVSYCNEIIDNNGYIYSIDNLRINFVLDKKYEREFMSFFASVLRTDIYHSEKFSHHSYRHLWTIKYDAKVSMTIGFSFNGNDIHSDKYKGFIDVNPNKTGMFEQFWNDFNKIKSYCKFINVARCDIAMDVPIKREYLMLSKDNRKYEQISCSHKNKTEYLGSRNKVGFTRVYNKTMESGLEYDLSRIEVSCLLSAESFSKYFPKVFDISRNNKISDELNSLNDTERAIVEMYSRLVALDGDGASILFNSMGRVMKNKLRKFISSSQSQIMYSDDSINALINNATELYL